MKIALLDEYRFWEPVIKVIAATTLPHNHHEQEKEVKDEDGGLDFGGFFLSLPLRCVLYVFVNFLRK